MIELNRLTITTYAELCMLCMSVILILTIAGIYYDRTVGKKFDRIILLVAVCYALYLIADTVWVIGEYRAQYSITAEYIINIFYFCFLLVAAYLWFLYICKRTKSKLYTDNRYKILIAVPALIGIAVVVSTFWSDLVFSIDSEMNYNRGHLFPFFYVINYGYYLAAGVIAFLTAKNMKNGSRIRYFMLAACSAPVLLSGLIQGFTENNYVCLGYVAAAIILFIGEIILTTVNQNIKLEESEDMKQLAEALIGEYESVLHIDFDTGEIESFRSSDSIFSKKALNCGGSYDEMRQINIDETVFEEDRARVYGMTSAEAILDGIRNDGSYTIRYRAVTEDGNYRWLECKFIKHNAHRNRNCAVAGVRDVDRDMRMEIAYHRTEGMREYNRLMGILMQHFTAVYYADLKNGKLCIFGQDEEVRRNFTEMTHTGEGPFEVVRNFITQSVHPEDAPQVMYAIKNAKDMLRKSGEFSLVFRRMSDDDYFYTEMRCTADPESGDYNNVIITYRNVDEEVKAEKESREQIEKAKNAAEELVKIRTAELVEKNAKLKQVNTEVIDLMGAVVESRDTDSGQHVQRVRGITKILANCIMHELPEYGLTDELVEMVVLASPLHDIGKIAIPDSILLKPGKLTPEEFEVIKTHCEKGGEILKNAPINWSDEFKDTCMNVCLYHHEKWDGKGYPKGLKENEIPLSAQIVAVADIYDALTTKRVYKDAYTHEEAMKMILNGECGEMNPKIKGCLLKCSESFKKLQENNGI